MSHFSKGAYNIDDTAQEIEVEKIVMHESYYKPIEFALLRLNTDATMGEGRGTVCLPDDNSPSNGRETMPYHRLGTFVSGTLRELQAGVSAALPRENIASMPRSAT